MGVALRTCHVAASVALHGVGRGFGGYIVATYDKQEYMVTGGQYFFALGLAYVCMSGRCRWGRSMFSGDLAPPQPCALQPVSIGSTSTLQRYTYTPSKSPSQR